MEKTFWIQANDQTDLYIKKWYLENAKPKAIIQLSHGMAEHIERYDLFAKALIQEGYVIYGNDHRGHGQTGLKQGLLGYISNQDGFTKLVVDQYLITKKIKEDYPKTPIILLGHSMGSFISRCYLQKYSHVIDGVIFSGTGYFPKIQTIAAMFLASILPAKKPSNIMNELAFGSYNKKITNPKTKNDWLSRDEEVVNLYTSDPLCGFIPTARFFVDLMKGIYQMQKKAQKIRKDIPMLFISGSEDPVGDYGKGVWQSIDFYKSLGVGNITNYFIEGARHEVLNEWDKEEAYTMINQWIQNQLHL